MVSEVGAHAATFMQHACQTPEFIESAVVTALETPAERWRQFPMELRDAVDIFGIRDRAAQQFKWLDIESLLWELVKIGSAPFWSHLLAGGDAAHAENLIKALRSTQAGAPAAMERNNRSFFGTSIPLVVLGALYGEEVKTFAGSKTTSTPAMEAVGGYFKTPAENGDVFLDRLRELFPQAHADRQPASAYSFLLKNNAFKPFDTRRSPCPVIKPTQAIFEAFGRVLAPSHQYGNLFLQTIGR